MRIQFERGEQRKFLEEVCNKLNKSLREINSDFKKESSVSYSTMKKYFREELTLPIKIADIFSQKSGIDWKKFRAKTIPSNWGSRKGGILGMQTLMKKYKNELKMWRSKGAKSSNKSKLKQILIPQSNEKLAELVGIALGDGTLTKYFLRISGDPRFDTSYFNYISNLCEGLFGLKPSLRKEKNRNLMYLTIYSANVCNFLNKLGLPFGDKIRNKAKIPEIFLRDLPLSIACLRGLIDTDGTVSKRANQLTLTFWSNNGILLNQV
jgi:intein/homing endonuclease